MMLRCTSLRLERVAVSRAHAILGIDLAAGVSGATFLFEMGPFVVHMLRQVPCVVAAAQNARLETLSESCASSARGPENRHGRRFG